VTAFRFRRRPNARRPAQAAITPGSPAPAIGPGTAAILVFEAAKPVAPAPRAMSSPIKFPSAFGASVSPAGACTVNMNSFPGETPVGTQRFPAVVVEQSTPNKKFPKPSSCGPVVGAVMGPVNPVVLRVRLKTSSRIAELSQHEAD
jgi:hypothetical protein